MHAYHADEKKNYVSSCRKTKLELVSGSYRKIDFWFDTGKNIQDNKDIKNIGYWTQNPWIRTPTPPRKNCM